MSYPIESHLAETVPRTIRHQNEGHHHGGDVVLMLVAGDTASLVATFPEDVTMFTEVACLLPGHYEAGMHTEVAYAA